MMWKAFQVLRADNNTEGTCTKGTDTYSVCQSQRMLRGWV